MISPEVIREAEKLQASLTGDDMARVRKAVQEGSNAVFDLLGNIYQERKTEVSDDALDHLSIALVAKLVPTNTEISRYVRGELDPVRQAEIAVLASEDPDLAAGIADLEELSRVDFSSILGSDESDSEG